MPQFTENEIDNADLLRLAEALKTNTSLSCLHLNGSSLYTIPYVLSFFIFIVTSTDNAFTFLGIQSFSDSLCVNTTLVSLRLKSLFYGFCFNEFMCPLFMFFE